MSSIKAIIFDMDGVLIDSLPAHYKSYVRIYSRFNINYAFREFVAKDITSGATNAIPRVLKEHNKHANVRGLLKEKNKIMTGQKVQLNKGVLTLLKCLKKNRYRIAVATGGTSDFSRYVMRKNKIRKYFDLVVTGQDHVRKKPYPDIFLRAAKKLGVWPGECVVIEDSHDGITAAKRAGMKVIGHYVPRYKQDMSGADKIVRSMSKINIEMIEKL